MKIKKRSLNIFFLIILLSSLIFIPFGITQVVGEPQRTVKKYYPIPEAFLQQDGKTITEYINLTKSYDNLTISRKDMEVVLEPYILLTNGNTKTLRQIKEQFPQIKADINITNYQYQYKFGLKVENIPDAVISLIDKIGFRRIKTTGLTWDDIEKRGTSLIIKNKITIDFRDAKDRGHTLAVNKTDFLIGNITYFIENNVFYLDPTIYYDYSVTKPAQKAYDTADVGDAARPPATETTAATTEFTSTEYTNIKNANETPTVLYAYDEIDYNDDAYPLQKFNFTINESAADITEISLNWDGWNEEVSLNDECRIFYRNFTANKWETLASTLNCPQDTLLSGKVTSNFADMVSASKSILILVEGDGPANNLPEESFIYTDFIELIVTATLADGSACTADADCTNNCDNDGVGLADDNKCFTCISTYLDNYDNNCEYDHCGAAVNCDERATGYDLGTCNQVGQTYFQDECGSSNCQYTDITSVCRSSALHATCTAAANCNNKAPGTDLNTCNQIGEAYYEDECSTSCAYADITSVFECTETGCSCTAECDGKAAEATINYCNKGGQTYFQDDCGTTGTAEDTNTICKSSGSLGAGDGCSADIECNGVTAGTNWCSEICTYGSDCNPPTINSNWTIADGSNCFVGDDWIYQDIDLGNGWLNIWNGSLTIAKGGSLKATNYAINPKLGAFAVFPDADGVCFGKNC